MQAHTHSPAAIFGNHVRHVVPLFQRPYVWTEKDQWAPLWEDVRTVAEKVLETPEGYGQPRVAPHFLGAIVLDQPLTPSGYIFVRHVIDGQQRLTTLQLLLNAAQSVIDRSGTVMDAQALRVLVRNEPGITQQPDEVFKVWPTDRDQAAFRAAMDGDGSALPAHSTSAIVQGHAFFVERIEAWAETTGDPDKARARLTALTKVLREHLKVVVIDLEPGDNAQVIFETLNHRGAPLLAADLIKNLIFQIALDQGRDVEALYRSRWRDLDGDYWRTKISRGRQYVPRIDIFVNYWLIARLRKEIQADRIFVEFRDHLFRDQPEIESLLADLARDAEIYASLESQPAASMVGRFHYRVIRAMDSGVVTPILLWLLRWPASDLPVTQRNKALDALESWLVRRAICRLTSKDINRLMLDLLGELHAAGPATAGDVTERFLAAQQADARFWPSDHQVAEALRTVPLYKALLRARLRMLLEAIEDHRRTDKSEQSRCPRNLTVEHVMPRAWREHWAAGVDDEQAAERDMLLHTLGNLTLVNDKLNPALSNRPWTDEQAQARGFDSGKRTELLKHATLKLNADLVRNAPDSWNEEQIRARTEELTQAVLEIWPVPAGGTVTGVSLDGVERDPAENIDEQPAGGEADGRYRPLTDWLRAQAPDELPVSFDLLEEILEVALPASARTHVAYWHSAGNAFGMAVAAAGFKVRGVNMTAETLVFTRSGVVSG